MRRSVVIAVVVLRKTNAETLTGADAYMVTKSRQNYSTLCQESEDTT